MQNNKASYTHETRNFITPKALQTRPYCASEAWVRIPRSFIKKLTHTNQQFCFCRACRQKFWRPESS
jgi:hypothetical protein